MTPELEAAVARYLESLGSGSRRAAAAALSGHYRTGGTSAAIDFAAYLTVRLPATFAAVAHVLAETARLRPDLSPLSLVDAGSGPGTASWAAVAQWPSLRQATFLDSNNDFLALAARLAQGSSHPALMAAQVLEGDIGRAAPDADAVVAAYALAELPPDLRTHAILSLWQAARRVLVIVEPGTPAGFATIRNGREALLARGAVLVAPCTHAGDCPVKGGDWCHFAVRLPRSRAHMHAKQARVPFEDEKFSYLVMAREGQAPQGARILSPPLAQKHGIGFKLCTAQGLEFRHVARRDGPAYKSVRKSAWGGML